MRLKKLYFKNHKTGWCLEDVKFGSLTLLVGASGVGKTQILKAIGTLGRIAAGCSYNGLEWSVEFDEDSESYVWSGRFEYDPYKNEDRIFGGEVNLAIERESLVNKAGEEIFVRDFGQLNYHGVPTVKLDQTQSAVELLKEQDDIAPINRAFKKISWLHLESAGFPSMIPHQDDINAPLALKDIKEHGMFTPIDKLFLVQKNDPELFDFIKEIFIDIFPLVEDIDFEITALYKDKVLPLLKIKERNVETWIYMPDISAGMCRTLSQIVALALADDGDVILIDEFENGLGINCIDRLADMAKDPDVSVQIIMTSHHPYIINAIPLNDWRIVSRSGSVVTVHTAGELRIGTHSRHDAFMQLMQTSAYRTGQS